MVSKKYDVGGDEPELEPVGQEAEEELTPQQKRAQVQKRARERSDALKGQYIKIKAEPAFVDLVAKIESFSAYHLKVAKDGVGFTETVTADGQIKQTQVKLSSEDRMRDLDRAAGIEEISAYIERMLDLKL